MFWLTTASNQSSLTRGVPSSEHLPCHRVFFNLCEELKLEYFEEFSWLLFLFSAFLCHQCKKFLLVISTYPSRIPWAALWGILLQWAVSLSDSASNMARSQGVIGTPPWARGPLSFRSWGGWWDFMVCVCVDGGSICTSHPHLSPCSRSLNL